MHFQRIAVISTFNIKWAHESVSQFGIRKGIRDVTHVFVILSKGIPGSGDHGISRLDSQNGLLEGREDARISFRINLVGFGPQVIAGGEIQSNNEKQ
jgi:hypothetical protein